MKNKKMIYITSSIVVILIIIVVAAIKVTTLNKEEDLKISAETMTINTTKKIFIDGVTTPEEKKSIYLNSTLGEIDKVKVNNKDEVKKDTVLFTYKNSPTGENKEIKAPCDGIVYISEPDYKGQTPYMTIQSKNYYIKGSVNEKDYNNVNVDNVIDITILATNNHIQGKVTDKSTNPIDSSSTDVNSMSSNTNSLSNYSLKIIPDTNDGLVNGFHVQGILKISTGEIKIPSSAIIKKDNTNFVYTVVDKKLKKVTVEVDKTDGDNTYIKSGLADGDNVIKSATDTMKEGDVVE